MKDINNHFTYAYSAGTEADFAQTVSGDAISTNKLNLKKAAINIAAGKRPIYLIIRSKEAASGTGSVEFQLVTATAADGTTGQKTIQKWRFADTVMTAGKLLVNQVLPVAKYQQYLAIYFNIFTTTGKFEAYLSDSPESAETDLDQENTGS